MLLLAIRLTYFVKICTRIWSDPGEIDHYLSNQWEFDIYSAMNSLKDIIHINSHWKSKEWILLLPLHATTLYQPRAVIPTKNPVSSSQPVPLWEALCYNLTTKTRDNQRSFTLCAPGRLQFQNLSRLPRFMEELLSRWGALKVWVLKSILKTLHEKYCFDMGSLILC